MSSKQWGHGFNAGIKAAQKESRHNQAMWKLIHATDHNPWSFVNPGVVDMDTCTVVLPCPYHYVLSMWTGKVYQVQSEKCLVSISGTILEEGFQFPFKTDCGWGGRIHNLIWALDEVDRCMNEMWMENKSGDSKACRYYHNDNHFVELLLPPYLDSWRGWAPRTVITDDICMGG